MDPRRSSTWDLRRAGSRAWDHPEHLWLFPSRHRNSLLFLETFGHSTRQFDPIFIKQFKDLSATNFAAMKNRERERRISADQGKMKLEQFLQSSWQGYSQ